MEFRKLGRTDISVSCVCLGCMGLVGKNQDEEDSVRTINAALDAGVTFFDTARAYQGGRNEELLGRVLNGKRDQVVIATKLNFLEPERIVEQCEGSLRRLQTDYIDLYHVHWPRPGADLDAALAALDKLKDQGKVRAIGVSNFGASCMKKMLNTKVRVDTNQLQYNLIWRPIEHAIQPLCVENDISILCYSALNMGLLTGKFKSADEVPPERAQHRLFASSRPGSRHSEPGCEEELFRVLGKIGEIAASVGKPMATVTMAWLLAQSGVTAVIAGARFPYQAVANAKVSELKLSQEIIDQLTEVSEPIKAYAGTNADQWESKSRMECE